MDWTTARELKPPDYELAFPFGFVVGSPMLMAVAGGLGAIIGGAISGFLGNFITLFMGKR